jgi:hypothetical protein
MPGLSLILAAGVAPAAHRSDVLDRLTTDASTLREMGLARCAVFGSFARVDFLPGLKAGDSFYAAHVDASAIGWVGASQPAATARVD